MTILSTGSSVIALPNDSVGEIYSVSPNCVNFKFGEMIVGVVDKIEQFAPSCILVSRGKLPRCTAGSHVKKTELQITGEKFSLALNSENIFNGKISKAKVNSETLEKVNSLIEQFHKNVPLKKIYQCFRENNFYNLVGLGCGSTPSGDDFLCGILAACKIHNQSDDLIKSEIKKALKNNSTTLLGRALLNEALLNKFPWLLTRMSEQLCSNFNPNFWEKTLRNPIHNSPIDMCAGLVAKLKQIQEEL